MKRDRRGGGGGFWPCGKSKKETRREFNRVREYQAEPLIETLRALGACSTLGATLLGFVDHPNESCAGTRQTEAVIVG